MPPPTPLAILRRHAVGAAFPPAQSLAGAFARIGFVQADPIRAPARAQDLILRHRVSGYRAGMLERRYPRLGLEEAFFHAYGFMTPAVHALLHPRHDPGWLDPFAARVLEHVRACGTTHPAELAEALGRTQTRNNWGGQSHATTRALDLLHRFGHLRVVGRRAGIRLFAAAPESSETHDPEERLRRLVLLLARLLAPVPAPTLSGVVARLVREVFGPPARPKAIVQLLHAGALEAAEIDGIRYLWPADDRPTARGSGALVRFLAPFDPLVWDRRRFEHLWGWPYRFEAYTPPAKRLRGYYAMPLLWGDAVIGWANCAHTAHGLDVQAGFVTARPDSVDFARAFDAEVARLAAFLAADPT